jgi:hypothetical protein
MCACPVQVFVASCVFTRNGGYSKGNVWGGALTVASPTKPVSHLVKLRPVKIKLSASFLGL